MTDNILKYTCRWGIVLVYLIHISTISFGQGHDESYKELKITPYRFALPPIGAKIIYEDLDNDGDPDILKTVTNGDVPVLWIDDDDDMKEGDVEGDTDSDCLLIDRNKDGKYGHAEDMIIDWGDEDKDGDADIQVFIENGKLSETTWWPGHYMIVVDTDDDKVFNYIDWNKLKLQAWEHNGLSHFFEDYLGKSLFLKIHSSTFNINDIRLNWENPFLFYDPDQDNISECAFRLVDSYKGVDGIPPHSEEGYVEEEEKGIVFTGNIDWVSMAYDLDNDNAPGNEFDFDMTIHFSGEGFSYLDQVHKFNSLKGLTGTDKYFYDPRWRNNDVLLYPDHESAHDLIFKKGKWDNCWLVFDEDDDCHRWERVELYHPFDIFKSGINKGGIDQHGQADEAGDRGEWDQDNSGNGNLYVASFDGRLHLYGAEWGAWRIDQEAKYYQGWSRSEEEPQEFASVKYEDSDLNGFIDKISYDLDADHEYEKTILLKELGIDDRCDVIDISELDYKGFQDLHLKTANAIWDKAQQAMTAAKKFNLNVNWYANLMQPNSIREKYHYGYWLNFYLHRDMLDYALRKDDSILFKRIEKAYYSGDWEIIDDKRD